MLHSDLGDIIKLLCHSESVKTYYFEILKQASKIVKYTYIHEYTGISTWLYKFAWEVQLFFTHSAPRICNCHLGFVEFGIIAEFGIIYESLRCHLLRKLKKKNFKTFLVLMKYYIGKICRSIIFSYQGCVCVCVLHMPSFVSWHQVASNHVRIQFLHVNAHHGLDKQMEYLL